MPGTWTIADVTNAGQRPGLYANFVTQALLSISAGITGVIASTVKAPWGPAQTVQSVKTLGEVENLYQNVDTGNFTAYFTLKNMLQAGAKEILVYRLIGPAGAKGTLTLVDTTGTPVDVITLTGKYEGARANNFTITIAANVADANRKDVTLKESTVVVKTWTTRLDNAAAGMIDDVVLQINSDPDNHWISLAKIADGNDTLANIADSSLASGADDEGNVVQADYTEAEEAFENERFSTIYLDTDDATIVDAAATWLTTLRSAGVRAILVTGSSVADTVATAKSDAEGFNNEAVVYVHPGFKDDNLAGTNITYGGYQAAARVAGLIAGGTLADSPTYKVLTDLNDLETRLKHDDIVSLLQSGVLPLIYDGSKFKIERGIDTLTTPGTTQNDSFKKIKVIRILDAINNTLVQTIADSVVGKVSNNSGGQTSVLGLIRGFLSTYVDQNLILDNYTVDEDPDNPPVLDRFFIRIVVQPVDSIEFVYLTIEIPAV